MGTGLGLREGREGPGGGEPRGLGLTRAYPGFQVSPERRARHSRRLRAGRRAGGAGGGAGRWQEAAERSPERLGPRGTPPAQ